MVEQINEVLKRVYYNIDSPACFSGVNPVLAEARRHNPKIKRQDVIKFLEKQSTYTKHKSVRRKFKRNHTVPIGYMTCWQIDLCDMQKLKQHNDKFAYILTCIDVLSRYVWGIPLKTKNGPDVTDAFQKILNTGHKCWRVASDSGKEFLNSEFQSLLKKEEITHMIPKNDIKCGMVERFNRTLKTRLWKYFTKNNTRRWITVLPKIVDAINNSKNRSIGCPPSSVTKDNATQLWLRLYGQPKKFVKFKFNLGDEVRISRYKKIFEKGYLQNFTTEIFTVCERLNRNPPVYRVKSHSGEILDGTFYGFELTKVISDKDDLYEIECIVKRRTYRGKKQLFVKWRDHPSSENSWISANDLVTLK